MSDLQNQMKQAVALAAVDQIRNGMVLGLGSGSTAALMIKELGARLQDGRLKDITGVTTSFQGEVLAAELGIPLQSLNAVERIDLAIDGADEVDPAFQLIKGGGACHDHPAQHGKWPGAARLPLPVGNRDTPRSCGRHFLDSLFPRGPIGLCRHGADDIP